MRVWGGSLSRALSLLTHLEDGAGPGPGRVPPRPGWAPDGLPRADLVSRGGPPVCREEWRRIVVHLFGIRVWSGRIGGSFPVSLASVGLKPGFLRLFTPGCALNYGGTRAGRFRTNEFFSRCC